MTYADRFGKYGIYTDGMVYKWFKTLEAAEKFWNENFADPDKAEEWLEEYDTIELRNMNNDDVLHELTSEEVNDEKTSEMGGTKMNGYEFTRFEADFTSRVKAQAYDAGTVALQICRAYDGCREDRDYEDAKEWFIDSTMSCEPKEAIGWMQYYMANAIAYGIQTKNLDWRTKFMAAYDLFNELA